MQRADIACQRHILRVTDQKITSLWVDHAALIAGIAQRIGKPVEINALWYHALSLMALFAKQLSEPSKTYLEAAQKAREHFTRFWNEETGYCFDVIDGPSGNEAYLRPNQLFAISLPAGDKEEPALFDHAKQKDIVDACTRHLLTSHGLRSLAPFNRPYVGHYGGDLQQRDGAYHQGTVWGCLICPFIGASLKAGNDAPVTRNSIQPLLDQLSAHGLGSISEIFDGDVPFIPRGCIAQAWSVAEVLRVWQATKAV